MSALEFYHIRFEGSRPVFKNVDDPNFSKAILDWAGKGTSLSVGADNFEQQYIAGHEETLLCRVFRRKDGAGGFVVVFDGTGVLLVAQADSNLALVAGAGHFARTATYIRYGADIFEHGDDED